MEIRVGYIRSQSDYHEIEAFDLLMRLLNWTAIYYELPHYDYGYLTPDGKWTGLVGLLNDGLIDCTANGMKITARRQQVADFSFPMAYFQQKFRIKMPKEQQYYAISDFLAEPLTSLYFIIKPFEAEVWVYLIALIASATIISFLFRSLDNLDNLFRKLRTSTWQTVAILLKQPFLERPLRATSIFMTSWLMFCLVFQIYYQCIISSRLIVPLKPQMPFGSVVDLIDLLDNNSWHLVYPLNLRPSCPISHCDKLMKALEDTPVRLLDGSEAWDDVLENKGIYPSDTDLDFVLQHYMTDRYGQYAVIRDDATGPSWVSYAFRKNFSRITEFNMALITIFPALVHIKNKRYPSEFKLYPIETSLNTKEVKLGLGQLGETFCLLLFGMAVAAMVLGAELYWKWSRPDRMVKDLRKFSNSRKGVASLYDSRVVKVFNIGKVRLKEEVVFWLNNWMGQENIA